MIDAATSPRPPAGKNERTQAICNRLKDFCLFVCDGWMRFYKDKTNKKPTRKSGVALRERKRGERAAAKSGAPRRPPIARRNARLLLYAAVPRV
jgi:hypothetical protein